VVVALPVDAEAAVSLVDLRDVVLDDCDAAAARLISRWCGGCW
jgi:hypothetical protein